MSDLSRLLGQTNRKPSKTTSKGSKTKEKKKTKTASLFDSGSSESNSSVITSSSSSSSELFAPKKSGKKSSATTGGKKSKGKSKITLEPNIVKSGSSRSSTFTAKGMSASTKQTTGPRSGNSYLQKMTKAVNKAAYNDEEMVFILLQTKRFNIRSPDMFKRVLTSKMGESDAYYTSMNQDKEASRVHKEFVRDAKRFKSLLKRLWKNCPSDFEPNWGLVFQLPGIEEYGRDILSNMNTTTTSYSKFGYRNFVWNVNQFRDGLTVMSYRWFWIINILTQLRDEGALATTAEGDRGFPGWTIDAENGEKFKELFVKPTKNVTMSVTVEDDKRDEFTANALSLGIPWDVRKLFQSKDFRMMPKGSEGRLEMTREIIKFMKSIILVVIPAEYAAAHLQGERITGLPGEKFTIAYYESLKFIKRSLRNITRFYYGASGGEITRGEMTVGFDDVPTAKVFGGAHFENDLNLDFLDI